MRTSKKLFLLLTRKERKEASLLLFIVIMMALLDTLGIASILPFVAVLSNPEIIETNSYLFSFYQILSRYGIENTQQFVLALGVIVFITLIISLAFKTYATYAQIFFTQRLMFNLSKRLIEGYLFQPYTWFASRHSADLGKTILSEASTVTFTGMQSLIELIAKLLVTISIVTLILLVDPKLAIIVSLTLGVSYYFIYYFVRKNLNHIGSESLENNKLRFKAVNEAFGAAKEIKVGGLEETYIENYSKPAQIFAKAQASLGVIAQIPRFFLEAIAFGGILLVILYIMIQTNTFSSAIPIISLYVFAGYRLMPAIHQIYSSITNIIFIGPSVDKLYEDLSNLKKPNYNEEKGFFNIDEKINLKNIHYSYPNSSMLALNNISLTIPAKSTVGFMGTTGGGKTTIADIILGLLEPQKGTLEVDDKIISKKNLRSWQRCIGYVPQHIYLTDDSIMVNIAFGVEPKNIDRGLIEKVAKIANLHDFIIDELPDKYQTVIGERGVRLSGGQRQRIGIARSLYHNPKLLILDEATSALDNQTEQAVMNAINNLKKDITIIIIAHRLNTLKKCDTVFLLERGELKKKGTYNELINSEKLK